MAILQVLLIIWTVFTFAFVALMIYRAQLTRHEVDEIFLNDNADHGREIEHDNIVRQVGRVDPFLKTAGGAAALLTVAIIGLYVVQTLPSVHF